MKMPTLKRGISNNKGESRGGYGSSGYTLIELAITLLIIALFFSIFLPKLPDVTGYRLKSYARRISTLVKYTRDRAVVEKNVFRLNYSLERGEYWVEVLKGQEWTEYNATFTTKGTLPFPIRFEEITTTGRGTMKYGAIGTEAITDLGKSTQGVNTTHFHYRGFVEKTRIVLADNRERSYILYVQPVSGRVVIEKGRPEDDEDR